MRLGRGFTSRASTAPSLLSGPWQPVSSVFEVVNRKSLRHDATLPIQARRWAAPLREGRITVHRWVMIALFLVLSSALSWSVCAADRWEHRLTVALNPNVFVTDNQIRAAVDEANALIHNKDYGYTWDVACDGVNFVLAEPIIRDSDLQYEGDFRKLSKNLKARHPEANVLIVASQMCGRVPNAAGCDDPGTEPLVITHWPGYDDLILTHERGHSVGLPHSGDPPIDNGTLDSDVASNIGMNFMFWRLGPGHIGKTGDQCARFRTAVLSSIFKISDQASPATSSGSPQPVPALRQNAGRGVRAGILTSPAFRVVGSPWESAVPLSEIKALSGEDLDSIRLMMKKNVNHYWSQASTVLALRGTADDVFIVKSPLEIYLSVDKQMSDEDAERLLALEQAQLAAPEALGVLANRTKSKVAVEILENASDQKLVAKVAGEVNSAAISRRALRGLAIADTPDSKIFLDKMLPALPNDEAQSILETRERVHRLGAEGLYRPD